MEYKPTQSRIAAHFLKKRSVFQALRLLNMRLTSELYEKKIIEQG